LILRWITIFKYLDDYQHNSTFQSIPLPYLIERSVQKAKNHLPIADADRIATGSHVVFYQTWMENLEPDSPLWEEAKDLFDMDNINVPVHFIGGWYDFFLRGLLEDFQELNATEQSPYLTIGPWHHFSQVNGMIQGLQYGIDWFDAHLKGEKSRMRRKAVRLYVMGADEWHEYHEFPPQSQETIYYLDAGNRLSENVSDKPISSHYRYDPSDPTPSVGGTNFCLYGGAKDNCNFEARDYVLIFTSAILYQPLTIIGFVEVELYVRSSLEYTDFFGRICDVHPDGKSINICDGLIRIKPEGKGEQQPDGTLKVTIPLWATAHQFKAGHQIRLQVSSGAHPRWNRNLGTCEPIATATTMRVADQTIYHDAEHPSLVNLPVVK
jgi:putative CocE/NonD family hydrolase